MIQNERGYTLIESLLVLSVFMILTTVTAFSLKPQSVMMNEQLFLSQLKSDLLYSQQYAISHQCAVYVLFKEDNYHYTIYIRYDLPALIERDYPKNIKVYSGSLPLYFNFLPDGNSNKSGSLYIQTVSKLYRLTFLIGKGRFYVVEV